jgi:hypothetical protein
MDLTKKRGLRLRFFLRHACQTPSFRDGPKDQTRNLEIPGSRFARPGMTMDAYRASIPHVLYRWNVQRLPNHRVPRRARRPPSLAMALLRSADDGRARGLSRHTRPIARDPFQFKSLFKA